MKLETERITAFQYMISIVCYIQASALLASFFTPIVQQDSWIVILLGIVTAMPFLFIYLALTRTFPGRNLIEMCECALGRVERCRVDIVYLVFYDTDLRQFEFSWRIYPSDYFVGDTKHCDHFGTHADLRVCGLKGDAVFSGFRHYGLCPEVLGIIFTLRIMDFNNFLPIFDHSASKYVQSAIS